MTAGVEATLLDSGRTSGSQIFPLHAARRMRSHGGSGEGTRLARAAAVAGDVAHRAASTGGFSRWLIEPFGHSYHARIAAGTFAGVEPLLPRRGCAAGRLRRSS